MKAFLAVVALVLLAATGWPSLCPAAQPTEVKLVYDCADGVADMFTPKKVATGGMDMSLLNGKGEVRVAGESVQAAAMMSATAFGFGVDANGDGKVDKSECVAVGATKTTARFKLKLGESKKEYAIGFEQLRVFGRNNVVAQATGRYFPAGCYRGTVNSVAVRILDDNLDGKITQDGQDAIAFGNSTCAMPLHSTHQIGGKDFELKVAEDGSTMSFGPQTIDKVALVDAQILGSPALKCMIMEDAAGKRSYDFAHNKTGVAPGTYKLVYGMIARDREVIPVLPNKNSLSYTVEGDATNTLRIGTPLRLEFQATWTNNTLRIFPNVSILGSGNERYQMDFSKSAPVVTLAEGSKVLSTESMKFG